MGTSVSRAALARIRTAFVACAAFALALGLAPAISAADESVAGALVAPEFGGDAQSASQKSILASTLTADGVSVISADVMLGDAAASEEPNAVIGSFTVDGLTFAVSADGVTLVSVSSDVVKASAPSGPLAVPSKVSYDGVTYGVTTIGPYAFYLSGATQVALPASIVSVDDRAFRSSDVERVDVDADNPNIASFDGCLYDSQLTSLLLIPEGRAGSVSIPSEAEVVEASKFSHCSLVDAISVDGDGAAFASWEGLLYDASGQTLLRVPAGAVDITIREGCTTIAAGAMEGCAKLERISAPSTVTSISPNVFESVPTVSLPSAIIRGNDDEFSNQITAMVALVSADKSMPEIDRALIRAIVPNNVDAAAWKALGIGVEADERQMPSQASTQSASTYAAVALPVYAPDGKVWYQYLLDYNVSSSRWLVNGESVASINKIYLSGGKVWWSRTDAEGYQRWYGINTSGGVSGAVIRDASNGTVLRTLSGTAIAPVYGDLCLNGVRPTWTVTWDVNGGVCGVTESTPYKGSTAMAPFPTRSGYRFLGWYSDVEGGNRICGAGEETPQILNSCTFYAQWEREDFDVSFETSAEPGDVDYLGNEKPSEVINVESGQVEIEDPQRPGYVFQGWVIPDADTGNKEALDQDLVYQGDDGKWYVDAEKLPDYATDGKVELTARWTSIISVDVPSAVTFYADVVTQGNESREGAASSAFGQSKVANQSQVDLRVVGLESSAVEATDTMLGADSILKKASAATPATSVQKLLSLYPSSKAWTAEELQDPDAVGGSKAATAVDFDLDDLLLEASFAADDFTIPAGDTLNMGYRLNLEETQQELDYDKLSTLEDGQSAAIANISYTFASDLHFPTATGSTSDDFYIEYQGRIYGPSDIKASANCIAEHGTNSPCYELYSYFLESGMGPADPIEPHGYVKWGDGITYRVRIIGINHDDKTDGTGKAGLTFQFVDCLNTPYEYNSPISGGTWMRYGDDQHYGDTNNAASANTNVGGWGKSELRANMNPGAAGIDDTAKTTNLNVGSSDDDAIWSQVPTGLRIVLAQVNKKYYASTAAAQSGNTLSVSADWLFCPSYSEVVASTSTYDAGFDNLKNEGAPYAFYKNCEVIGNDVQISEPPSNNVNPNPLSVCAPARANAVFKWQIGKDGNRVVSTAWKSYRDTSYRTWYWWERSVSPTSETSAMYVTTYSNTNGNFYTSPYRGVSPCFCL